MQRGSHVSTQVGKKAQKMVAASHSALAKEDKQEVIDLRGASDEEDPSPPMKPRAKQAAAESKTVKGAKRPGPGRPPKMGATQSGAKQDPAKRGLKKKEGLKAHSEEKPTDSEEVSEQQTGTSKEVSEEGGVGVATSVEVQHGKRKEAGSADRDGKRAKMDKDEHSNIQAPANGSSDAEAAEKDESKDVTDLQTPPKRGPGRPKGTRRLSKLDAGTKGAADDAGKVLRNSRIVPQRKSENQKLKPLVRGHSEEKMPEEKAHKPATEAASSEDSDQEAAKREFAELLAQAPERRNEETSKEEAQKADTAEQKQGEPKEELGHGGDSSETESDVKREANNVEAPELVSAAAEDGEVETKEDVSSSTALEQLRKAINSFHQAAPSRSEGLGEAANGAEAAVEKESAEREVPETAGPKPQERAAVMNEQIAGGVSSEKASEKAPRKDAESKEVAAKEGMSGQADQKVGSEAKESVSADLPKSDAEESKGGETEQQKEKARKEDSEDPKESHDFYWAREQQRKAEIAQVLEKYRDQGIQEKESVSGKEKGRGNESGEQKKEGERKAADGEKQKEEKESKAENSEEEKKAQNGEEEEEADTPKTAAEKMTTRGKRVPVKRLWDEEEVLPQRNRPDKLSSKTKGGFMCDICGLIFQNGQALGGHKGSHKADDWYTEEEKRENTSYGPRGPFKKLHSLFFPPKAPAPPPEAKVAVETRAGWACEICGVVFPTGQALGGHKGLHKSLYQNKELLNKERSEGEKEGDNKSVGKRVIKRPTPLITEIGTAASKGMGKATGTDRSKDRLQSLAAMLSKRARQNASVEGEKEREESSKRIIERLKRTAERRAEDEQGLSPAPRGKGMDSFEEDAIAGLMVLRQPILLAAEKERNRRKRARAKSSTAGAGDDEGTLAAVKALVGKSGVDSDDEREYDPEKDSDNSDDYSSGAEKSGSKERREEDRPRRPETRTKEERRVTRKLRELSDDEEVWRPRVRKDNPDRKRQRSKPKLGLLSDLVQKDAKQRTSNEGMDDAEEGPADGLRKEGGSKEGESVIRLFGKPLTGGFKVPSSVKGGSNVTKPQVMKAGSPPFSIPVTEETKTLGADSDEERELLPLSALKHKGSPKLSKKERKKDEAGKRKRAEDGEPKRKRKKKAGKEGDESRSGSPTEKPQGSGFGLKRLPGLAKLGGEGARGFDVKKLASALKNGGKGTKKLLDSDEDAPIGLKMRSPEKKKATTTSEQDAIRRRKRKEELRRKLRAGILTLPTNGASRVSDPGSITEANSASEEDVPIGRRYSEGAQKQGSQYEEDLQRAVQESVAMLQQLSAGAPVENASERKRAKKEARARKRFWKEAAAEEGQEEEPREKRSKRSRKEKGSGKTSPAESQEGAPPPRHGNSSKTRWPHPSSSVNEFLEKLGLTTDFTEKALWKRNLPPGVQKAADELGVKSKVPGYTVLTEEEAFGHAPKRTQLDRDQLNAAFLALRSAVDSDDAQRKERLDLNLEGGLGLPSRSSSPAHFLGGSGRPSSTPPSELGAFYRDKGVVKNGKWLPMQHPQEREPGRERMMQGSANRCQPDLPAVKTGLSQFLKGFTELRNSVQSPSHAPTGGALRAPSHEPASLPLDLNLGMVQSPSIPSSYGQLTEAIRIAASEREALSRKWPPSWLPTSLEGRRELFSSGGVAERPYAPPRFDPRDQTGISGPPLFRGPQPDVWRQSDGLSLGPDRPWPASLHPRGGEFEMQRGVRMPVASDRKASPGFLELRVMEPPKQDGPLFAEEEISEKRANLAFQTLLKNTPLPQAQLHRDLDLIKSAETLRRLLGKNEDMTSPAIRSFAEGVKNMLLEGSKLLPESEVHDIPRPEMLSLGTRSAGLAIPLESAPTNPLQTRASEAEAPKQATETVPRVTTSTVPSWLLPEIEKRRRSMQEGTN